MNAFILHTLKQTPAQEITLSSLIGNNITPTLSLQVTLASHVHATIIDDLEEYKVNDCTLVFVLQERSYLSLKMRSIHKLNTFSSMGNREIAFPGLLTTMTEPNDIVRLDKELSRNVIIRLVGEHAQAVARYACLGGADDRFKFTFLQEHQAERCTSHVVMRSVLDDNARLFCKGLIHIQKSAQHTHAELENKNVLLGSGSRAVSIPTLEIEANDVVCKHGAAISKLDEEQFFYLQSRGIAVQQARTMLIESFLTL